MLEKFIQNLDEFIKKNDRAFSPIRNILDKLIIGSVLRNLG